MKGDTSIIMNDLLMNIDQIDQSVNDSEINVLESMIQSYDKSIMILESYEGEDFSAFDIFQEGEKWDKFKEDTKAPVFGKKGESVAKRFLMLIPRLIQKLIALIKRLFVKNKNVEQKMEKDIQTLKSKADKKVKAPLTREQYAAIKKMFENKPPKIDPVKKAEKDFEDTRNRVNDSMSQRHEAFYDAMQKSLNNIFKVDEKNPGLIDELLEELGVPPREQTPLSERMLIIDGSTLFMQLNIDDTNFGLFSDFNNRTASSVPELGYSQEGDINKLIEYTKSVNHSIEYIDKKINEIIKGKSASSNKIRIKFGDAVNMMSKMKELFDKDYESIRNNLERINAALPKFKEREKEIEVHLENEVKSDNFNPDTSLTVKESEAMSKYLMALTSLQIKLDTYCQAVLHRWNIDYRKIMTAIEHEETNINLNSN
jgi:hypothetical protein